MLPIVATLLATTEPVFSESLKPLVRKWSDPPASHQVLEVWDRCRIEKLGNMAALEALGRLYAERLAAEEKILTLVDEAQATIASAEELLKKTS